MNFFCLDSSYSCTHPWGTQELPLTVRIVAGQPTTSLQNIQSYSPALEDMAADQLHAYFNAHQLSEDVILNQPQLYMSTIHPPPIEDGGILAKFR